MRMQSNTIFITGASSGIGRRLAESFHRLGNQVIIGGRRESLLKEICAANPGMRHFVLDVADPNSIQKVAAAVMKDFPKLNCVFNNAGIQNRQDFSSNTQVIDRAVLDEININLLGTIRISLAFIPHLQSQQDAVLMNVSSGLAFVPLSLFPVYCATKAAVHSFSLSLRHQLKGSGIKVVELVPPYVETELGGVAKGSTGGPQPMPLDAFITAAMQELAGDADEVAIGDAKNLMGAAGLETVKKVFANMNR